MDTEWSSFHSSVGLIKFGADKSEKEKFQRDEWFGHMLRFRNDAIIILSIICLQLPFELAYAHLYESIGSDIIKCLGYTLCSRTLDYYNSVYFEDDPDPDPELKAEPKTPNIPFFLKEEEIDEDEMDKLMEGAINQVLILLNTQKTKLKLLGWMIATHLCHV